MESIILKLIGFFKVLILWAIGLFFVGYFLESPVFKINEVVVYERGCYGSRKIAECPSSEQYFTKTSFKVSFDTQVVISNLGNISIETFKDCTVYDKNNWQCERTWMRDGEFTHYFEDTKEYRSDYWQQISRLSYTFWNTLEMFGL